ncbi:lysylphosphatidylglycerol synthase transmembrane domain-containing protein [Adhaeribacter aquaticus]|uniref:lysylphosphatidylglycerol synthase transmembrane domain-containing protein n=1 Tax=Adhaeribacter aquaticus TaxID=299567 RepID=UPI000408A3CD|nr:lysylphosphatidylglycerol synthase transmembrane domain-containing protein [Adhaeribacter aquaticus]
MKKLLDILKYVFLFGMSFFLMWYALKGIDLKLLQNHLQEINYFWLGISLLVALAGFASRAYRWKMQLAPISTKVSFKDTYHATMIGYLANLVLPRMGEVFRCTILKRSSDIPVQASFGTVITERLLDMVMLLLLMGLAFLVEFEHINTYFLSLLSDKYYSIQENKTLLYLLVGFGIGGLLVVIFLAVFYLNQLREIRFFQKAITLIKGFLEGVFSLSKVKNKPAFVAHTIFIWFSYYLMGYLSFFALPATAHLSPFAALSVLVIGSLGMSVPVQGGIGVFHIMVRSTLLLYGISKEAGMAFALINHTSQTLMVVLLGGISFLLSLIKSGKSSKVVAVPTDSISNEITV